MQVQNNLPGDLVEKFININREMFFCPHCKKEKMNYGFLLRMDDFYTRAGGYILTSGYRCDEYYKILYERLKIKYNNPGLKVPSNMPHKTGLCSDVAPRILTTRNESGFYIATINLFKIAESSGLFNKIGIGDNFLHVGASIDKKQSRWYYDSRTGEDYLMTDGDRNKILKI